MPSEEYAKKHFAIEKNKLNIKTKFIDKLNAVKVEMIDFPDIERAKKVLVNMSEASWFEDFYSQATEEDTNIAIEKLLSGVSLSQGIEALQFTFKISGLDLTDSHALVRQRIGVSFMQQSQAIRPFTDADCLVPRAFTQDKEFLRRYKKLVVDGKRLYQDMLESGNISITDARLCLLKTCPPVWIYMSCNLITLLAIYKKRSDSQEEYIALNKVMELCKNAVIEKFPYMEKYFICACDAKQCFHNKAGYTSNCIFKRDSKHQLDKGVKDNWTLHEKTKSEMMLDYPEYETEYYLSQTKVTKEEFENEPTK